MLPSEGTDLAATNTSLDVFGTFCLAFHIDTRAQAPTRSNAVHIRDAYVRDSGSITENRASNKGDYRQTCEL